MHRVRRRHPLHRLSLACALALSAAPAFADIVVFGTGRAKEGIVVEESDTMVRFETKDGVVGIPRSAVEAITYADEAENRELRRQWAVAREAEERERALRQAEREREREGQEAAGAPAREAAEQERRAQERKRQLQDQKRIAKHQQQLLEARQKAAEEAKQPAAAEPQSRPAGTLVDGHPVETDQAERQSAESQPTAETAPADDSASEAPAEPIGFQPLSIEEVVAAPNDQGGTTVTASLVNFGTVAHVQVLMDVELVENARTPNEFVVQRQAQRFAVIPAESIVRIDLRFSAAPTMPFEARIVNLESSPGS